MSKPDVHVVGGDITISPDLTIFANALVMAGRTGSREEALALLDAIAHILQSGPMPKSQAKEVAKVRQIVQRLLSQLKQEPTK